MIHWLSFLSYVGVYKIILTKPFDLLIKNIPSVSYVNAIRHHIRRVFFDNDWNGAPTALVSGSGLVTSAQVLSRQGTYLGIGNGRKGSVELILYLRIFNRDNIFFVDFS